MWYGSPVGDFVLWVPYMNKMISGLEVTSIHWHEIDNLFFLLLLFFIFGSIFQVQYPKILVCESRKQSYIEFSLFILTMWVNG